MPNRPNPRRRNFKKASKSNNTGASNRASDKIMIQPRLKPVVRFSRTVVGLYNVICDGINPSLVGAAFTLSALPNPTDYTNLFQSYRISKIKVRWDPEYTELTDAALVSNAVNVMFNSVVDQTDPTPPATVGTVTQYQTCKSTPITKPHVRTFEPAVLSANQMPCNCYISTQNSSERHYGIKIGVDPTGVPMTFRSTVTMWFECAGSR